MLDPRTHNPTNSFQLYDETRQKTHGYEATNSGLWPSKPAQFRTEPMEMDVDESGICSPPRWSTSPQRYNSHYRSFSPSSRTEAIARGQRELMEMVRSMPESNYELSLKDLVEHHRVVAREENTEEERNSSVYKGGGGGGGGGGRKVEKMAQVKKRNGNIDRGGFYLKVVFPFSLGSKDKKNKKKKNESSGNSSSKVSPKPSASNGSVKGVDKEWWKKSPSAYRESDSSSSVKSSGSSSSSNSSSSRRSNSRREKRGVRCWHFIRRPKSQAKK